MQKQSEFSWYCLLQIIINSIDIFLQPYSPLLNECFALVTDEFLRWQDILVDAVLRYKNIVKFSEFAVSVLEIPRYFIGDSNLDYVVSHTVRTFDGGNCDVYEFWI